MESTIGDIELILILMLFILVIRVFIVILFGPFGNQGTFFIHLLS